jgi:hypothetical protein
MQRKLQTRHLSFKSEITTCSCLHQWFQSAYLLRNNFWRNELKRNALVTGIPCCSLCFPTRWCHSFWQALPTELNMSHTSRKHGNNSWKWTTSIASTVSDACGFKLCSETSGIFCCFVVNVHKQIARVKFSVRPILHRTFNSCHWKSNRALCLLVW